MKILSIGNFSSYNQNNTALHRNWALCNIGKVTEIDCVISYNIINRFINRLFRIGIKIPFLNTTSFNHKIINVIKQDTFDLVWIDKGVGIKAYTLKSIKELSPKTIIIGYSPDEMTKVHNQSYDFLQSLPFYDYYITTKSYAVEGLKNLGAQNVLFVNNAYEEKFHYPHNLVIDDYSRLGADIGFIGAWEMERAESILFLAKNGLHVRVWGDQMWQKYKNLYPNLRIENSGLYSEDYCKAFKTFKINLCFLRKINNDIQTTRTMEIPACGGFMLAERTTEHEKLFKEGEECDFFSSDEELLQKCQYYLSNNELRVEIAEKGRERCVSSGYSNSKTIEAIIKVITLS